MTSQERDTLRLAAQNYVDFMEEMAVLGGRHTQADTGVLNTLYEELRAALDTQTEKQEA